MTSSTWRQRKKNCWNCFQNETVETRTFVIGNKRQRKKGRKKNVMLRDEILIHRTCCKSQRLKHALRCVNMNFTFQSSLFFPLPFLIHKLHHNRSFIVFNSNNFRFFFSLGKQQHNAQENALVRLLTLLYVHPETVLGWCHAKGIMKSNVIAERAWWGKTEWKKKKLFRTSYSQPSFLWR
jgi:hypothetical protein